jgi:hypothetical protein
MVLAELFQQQREHVEADGHPADEVERAAQDLLLVGDAGRRVVDVVEDPMAELSRASPAAVICTRRPRSHEQALVESSSRQQDLAG